jgi:hypothetical protein
MSSKAVKAYRRENPGSKLKTAVTTKPSKLKKGSKAAKRRKSFCARMSGNKGPMKKPNGKPTPKALALRRWNCESIEEMAQMILEGERMIADMKQQGVAEDADQAKKVFKDKAGQPVGEIGIDPESSPGNGEWYVHHYATGYSVVGFDSAAEAKRELLYVHKHPDAVDGHPSTKEQGVAEAKQKGVDGKACWDGYKRMGTKQKGGKTVDNCVPTGKKK